MKILLASHLFFPEHKAGTEVLTLELARSLRSKGHEIKIITCSRHEAGTEIVAPWLSMDEYDGFEVSRIHFAGEKNRTAIAHHANSPERVELLVSLVKEFTPDLVHFLHINGFSSSAIPAVRKLGTPVFFTATDFWAICSRTNLFKPHNDTACSGPETPAKCLSCAKPNLPRWLIDSIMAAANKKSAKFSVTLSQVNALKTRLSDMCADINAADKIFVATNFQANMLTRYGINADSMKTVPYGVRLGSLPDRTEIPSSFSAASPMKIIFIGSLTRIKGVHVLLEALSKLDAKTLACLDVGIYGTASSNDKDYSRHLINQASLLEGKVKFLGTFPHEDIGSILRNTHLLVVPSIWYENAPLVLCSALASGTPVLVSRLGGMTEIIQEGVDGLSFGAGDAAGLADILSKLCSDPEWIENAATRKLHGYRKPDDYADEIETEYLLTLSSSRSIESN
ncbi:MAG: glycosyltransferase [Arenimonas sp.]